MPFEVAWESGSFPADIAAVGLIIRVVSIRALAAFREAGLKGWSSFPVVARGKDGKEVPDYHGLVVHGRVTGLDKAHVRVLTRKAAWGEDIDTWVGYRIRKEDWDGSDFFFTGDTGFLFGTDRARRVFDEYKLTGAELLPLEEEEFSSELTRRGRGQVGGTEGD